MKAFAQIKVRFALLCVLLSGAVLLAACLLGWQNARRQAQEGFQEQLDAQFSAMENQLRTVNVVSELALYRFETENEVWVSLYDNGRPVGFRNHPGGQARAALLGSAQKQVNWALPYAEESTALTLADENGARYEVRFANFRTPAGTWCGVLMAKPAAGLAAETARLRLVWGLVFGMGLLALGAVGLLMGRLAATPALQAHQRQAQFMAAAGHELKSPLAVIQSSAEMVAKDPARTPEYMANITGETARMNRLVEDLLVLCGGDAARLAVKPQPTDPETLLLTVYDRFLPLAQKQGYRLAVDFPKAHLPPVLADEDRVMQLLGILLSNAFDYATPGTTVTLFAAPQGRYLAVGVADEGPGLSREDKRRVMERFYRGEESRAHGDNHYGLGLSVAQEIAALHKGRLVVRDSPQGGSTFVFLLPRGTQSSNR